MSPGMAGANLGAAEVVPGRSTAKALLVQIADEDEPRWIPKSVIHEDSEVYRSDSEPGTLVVERWWAEKEGLI